MTVMFLCACRALCASDIIRFFFLVPSLYFDLLETSKKLAVRLQNLVAALPEKQCAAFAFLCPSDPGPRVAELVC